MWVGGCRGWHRGSSWHTGGPAHRRCAAVWHPAGCTPTLLHKLLHFSPSPPHHLRVSSTPPCTHTGGGLHQARRLHAHHHSPDRRLPVRRVRGTRGSERLAAAARGRLAVAAARTASLARTTASTGRAPPQHAHSSVCPSSTLPPAPCRLRRPARSRPPLVSSTTSSFSSRLTSRASWSTGGHALCLPSVCVQCCCRLSVLVLHSPDFALRGCTACTGTRARNPPPAACPRASLSRACRSSASRIGESDGKVNRKRIKAIRVELQKKGWKSIGY